MTLLAVERIKLFSTRSPWMCTALAIATVVGLAAIIAGSVESAQGMNVPVSQFGYQMGLAVIMVLGALAITTEYRFSTIRTTFQAVPHRSSVLLAKATVVALLAGVIGEIAAFSALGVARLMQPEADLALNSAADWRNVAGVGAVFAIAAVLAVAVGTMIRHTAGAISLLMIYGLVAEDLVQLIPGVGEDIYKWLPFNVANKFLTGNPDTPVGAGEGPPPSNATLSPGWALAYFAGIAAVLLIAAILSARKRDA
ncbi:MAG: hypothetical protein GEU98_08285 [Pseudonocardiaceae bacterium]|nr:hypothetical protein [Pseudonocardiaceae bacterium]